MNGFRVPGFVLTRDPKGVRIALGEIEDAQGMKPFSFFEQDIIEI